MPKLPLPRFFADCTAFVEAFVAAHTERELAAQGWPGDLGRGHFADPNWDEIIRRARHMATVQQHAREDALDRWDAHVAHATEIFDRGVGPAWAS